MSLWVLMLRHIMLFSILLLNASLFRFSYTILPYSRCGFTNLHILTTVCLEGLLRRLLRSWIPLFYRSVVIEFFIKIQLNMFLNGRHFPCINPITNFIMRIIKLRCWIILILNNRKEWCVSSKNLQQRKDSIRQIIYVKRCIP